MGRSHADTTRDLTEKLKTQIKEMSTAVHEDRRSQSHVDIQSLKQTVTSLQTTVAQLYEARTHMTRECFALRGSRSEAPSAEPRGVVSLHTHTHETHAEAEAECVSMLMQLGGT